MSEKVNCIHVFLESEEFGHETFTYANIDQAVGGIRRLWGRCNAMGDGIERRIGLVATPAEDESRKGQCAGCGSPVETDDAELDMCGIAHCADCYTRLFAECKECGGEVPKNEPTSQELASGEWLCWVHADEMDTEK